MKKSLAILFLAILSHVCTAEIIEETQPSAKVVFEGQAAPRKHDALDRVLYGGMYGGYGGGWHCCQFVCEGPSPRRSYYSSRSKSMMMSSRRTKETVEPDEESERDERALYGKGYGYGGYGGYSYGGEYGYGGGYGYGSMGNCRYDCSACGHYPPHMCFASSTVSDGCDCDCQCCATTRFGDVVCSCDCDCPGHYPPIYRSKAMMMGGGSGSYYGSGDYGSDDYSGGSMMTSGSGHYGSGSGGDYDDDYDDVDDDDDEYPDVACCEPEIVCNPVEEVIEVDESGSRRERNLQEEGDVMPMGRVGGDHYPQGPGMGPGGRGGIGKDCQVVGCLIYGNPTCEKEEPEDDWVPPPPPPPSGPSSGMTSGSSRSYGPGKQYPQSIEHIRQ